MSQNLPPWLDELALAATVTDEEGTIIAMNSTARSVFAKSGGGALVGQSVYDCHPAGARDKIRQMFTTGKPGHYTITKNGKKKIIHQLPRLRDGKVVGLVEISVELPEEMAHFNRDVKP